MEQLQRYHYKPHVSKDETEAPRKTATNQGKSTRGDIVRLAFS